MTHHNWVKPTHTTWTASCCTILMTYFTNAISHFIKQLSWERSVTYTTRISFTYTYNLINFTWTNTRTNCHTTSDRVWRSNKWISALVNVQHDTLCTFKKYTFTVIKCIVQDNGCICHILLDLLAILIVLFKNIINWNRGTVIQFFKQTILFRKIAFQAFTENILIQKIRNSNPYTSSFIHVGWANTLDSSPDFIVALSFFLQTV